MHKRSADAHTPPKYGQRRLQIVLQWTWDPAGEKSWADRLARIFTEIEPLLRAQQLM